MSASRKIISLTAFLSLLLLTGVTVFSAQDAMKPPVWVGIYTTAGKVGLKWSPAAGAARYQVYRTLTSGKGYDLIATTTDVSYIDAGVRSGETYYYVLKAVFSDGKESGYSQERYIKVPVTGGGLPVKPPVWVGALLEEKSIKLAWLRSPSSNALAYNVYKSKSPDRGFQLIGSTQDTNLTDTDVKEGETYYYALTALDREFKETKFSQVRAVAYALPKAPAEAPGAQGAPGRVPRRGEKAYAPPDKIIAKPTRIIGFILKGKDDKPFCSPTDIALGPNGNIYVTDTGTSMIQIFNPGGESISAIGGFGKQEGKFERLLGVDVDKDGYVYGVDAYTGIIQKFDREGRLLMRKKMLDDGKAIAQDLGLKNPVVVFGIVKPVVSPAGDLYLLDNFNDCIEVYTPNGRFKKAFGGRGKAPGKLQGPTFATFGTDGQLYVSDCINARVQVFDKEGKFLWNFGRYGNVVGSFSRPKGISIDDGGHIYVADSMANVVQVFDNDGRFLFLLADERGKQMDLATPNGIVMDKKKRIYMVEKLVNRVQIRQVGE
jgi:DNA-binding beta-propeller fold protein YncE